MSTSQIVANETSSTWNEALSATNRSTSTWIEQADYVDLQFEPSLQAFAAQRAELVTGLEQLEPRDWSRAATITGAGRPLERTVLFYATWLTRHEQTHLKQIQAAVRTVSNT